MGELLIDLHASGMTPLHRAGVAGLHMTVRALEARKQRPAGWVAWEAGQHTVRLEWDGTATAFFESLVKSAFDFDRKDGLIEFAAIDRRRATPSSRWLLHEGMLGTFCQFGPNNGLGPRRSQTLSDDEGRLLLHFEYRPIDPSSSKSGRSYPHRDSGGREIGNAIDRKRTVPLTGWLYPGTSVRHVAFTDLTAFSEEPARALALLFAPVGCFFFKLQSTLLQRKARYALLIPEIGDLDLYAEAREFAAEQTRVADTVMTGAGQAALRFLTWMKTRGIARDIEVPRVLVYVLGTVIWNEKQKSRTARLEVAHVPDETLKRFQSFTGAMPCRTVPKKDGGTFLAQSSALELFCENLANRRPFFEGFSELIVNKDIRKLLQWERKGLSMMVRNPANFDDDAQARFVVACQRALQTHYGKAGERAKSDKVDAGARLGKEYERWRFAFSRAKSADSFREAMADYFSRAGVGNAALQSGWRDFLPFFSASKWRLARDLALLALASYGAADKNEAENPALEATTAATTADHSAEAAG